MRNGCKKLAGKGPKGNIEYLVYLTNQETFAEIDVENVVNKAHEET